MSHDRSSGRATGTHDIDHGCQEVDEDGDEDDDVPRRVRLVDPAAGLAQDQRQTLVVLCRCDEYQAGMQDDEDRELDHHGYCPVEAQQTLKGPPIPQRPVRNSVVPLLEQALFSTWSQTGPLVKQREPEAELRFYFESVECEKHFSEPPTMSVARSLLPGRGKQVLDGGDEDEHDEGAHQVGLEHLIPHLRVLQHERQTKKKEEEEEERKGRRGEDGETRVETNGKGRTGLDAPVRSPHRHRHMQWFRHEHQRETGAGGPAGGPGKGAETSATLGVSH